MNVKGKTAVGKLCLLFGVAFFLLLFSFFVMADEPLSMEEHYEQAEDANATVYNALDLYRLVFEEEPSEVVREYLSYISGARFYVSDSVSANVRAFYSEGVLTAEASAYTYTAQNGKSVTFLPKSFHFGSETLPFRSADGKTYIADKNCSQEEADTECSVTYQAEFCVNDAVLEELLNGAFSRGQSLLKAQTAYEKQLSAYEKANDEFQSYKDRLARYYEDCALYEQYLKAKGVYERDYALYQEYLLKKEAYDALLAKYKLYEQALADYQLKLQEYNDYTCALEEYTQNSKKYRETTDQRIYETAKLNVINSAYFGTETLDSMYVTLRGETVSLVVSEKETIVKYAGDWDGLPQAIDTADLSSERLKVLLGEYRALSSLDAKYAYYATHYEEILDNFCSLYSSLDHLFDNAVVQTTLKKHDRYERYKEFLAQLFILSTCFDDEVTLDTSVVIADGDRIRDLIGDDRLIIDANHARPSLNALPPEMQQPIKPTAVSKPEKPKLVAHPGDAPPIKAEPTKPIPVEKPIAPAEVLQPTPPAVLQRNSLDERLYQAVKKGSLTERQKESQGAFSLSSRVDVVASIPERVTVSYYDSDGKTLLYAVRLEEGNGAFYGGANPSKKADRYASYEFMGFYDVHGNLVEDGTVFLADICLYARYRVDPITYTVTFSVNGKTNTSTYLYGETPVAPSNVEKQSDAQYHYVFDGWDRAVSYVTADAVYTATYRRVERMYKVAFAAKGSVLVQTVLPYGAMPEFDVTKLDKQVTDRYVESFSRWTPVLAPVTGDAVYTAVYRQLGFGYDGKNQPISATANENGILEVLNTTTTFTNGALFEYLSESKNNLSLVFPAGSVLITHGNAQALIDADALSVSLTEEASKRKFAVSFKDKATVSDALFEVTFDVSAYLRDDATFHIYELLADGTRKQLFFTVSEGRVTLDLRANTEILLANVFDIGVNVGGGSSEVKPKPEQKPEQMPEQEKPTESIGGASSETLPMQAGTAATLPTEATEEPESEIPNAPPSASDPENATSSVPGTEAIPEGDLVLSMEGGSISLDCESAIAGDPVTVTAYPLYGYYLKSLMVMTKNASGEEEAVALQGMTFIMPNGPVTVNAEFALRTYTLSYVDQDGTVLLEKTLTFFDEEPTVSNPTGDAYRAFDCWEKSGSIEEGKITYTARYREIVYADPETSYRQDYGGWRFRDYIPHALVVLSCVGAVIAFCFIMKKRKGRKGK